MELEFDHVTDSRKIRRNDPCPCGSGLKYKRCCGKVAHDMNKPMLKSVHIQNFRCFRRLDINSLARVNLIAGKNSVGKTAALEAIFLLIGAENLELILRISKFRGIGELKGDAGSILELLWSPLFYQLQVDRKIKIRAGLNRGKERKVELALVSADSGTLTLGNDSEQSTLRSGISASQILEQKFTDSHNNQTKFEMKFVDGQLKIQPVSSKLPFPGYFLSARRSPSQGEVANLFGRLVKSKQVQDLELVNILKLVEPRLLQLDVIPSAGSSMIYGDIGLDQMLPISLMGDGMERVIGIVLRIANASGGIVLIDEVENGIHHSILSNFWQVIDKAARDFDTQVIATTHGYECIREAHKAFSASDSYDFLFHRLDRIGDRVESATYDQEALEAAIKAEFEVR